MDDYDASTELGRSNSITESGVLEQRQKYNTQGCGPRGPGVSISVLTFAPSSKDQNISRAAQCLYKAGSTYLGISFKTIKIPNPALYKLMVTYRGPNKNNLPSCHLKKGS